MGRVATTKLFKSGNSVAVRLPAAFHAKPGTPVEVREEMGVWVVDPTAPARETIDLRGVWGSCPGLKALTPEEREFEERELDWTGKRANG